MRTIVGILALQCIFFLEAIDCAHGGDPAPELLDVRRRMESAEATRIVCFGDSITGAYYHTGGKRAWCDMLGVALERLYPKARIEMINAGISGHTTVQGLARINKDVLAKQPHLVVVMFGMNDVARLSLDEFAANLQKIIDKCNAAGSAVVLCTPNSVYENAARPNDKLAVLAERIRQIAKDQSLPVADCFADYQQRRERDPDGWMLLMSDEIHPNMNGHCRFAELIAHTIAGRHESLDKVPPPADALHHTLELIEKSEPVHVVAMPPYDQLMADALRQRFPQATIQVTTWPIESKSLAEMRRWAEKLRDLKPDLVIPAVPPDATAPDAASYVRDYEWVLNFSFPFAGRAWDVAPVLRDSAEPAQQQNLRLARQIILGKDLRFLERLPQDGAAAISALVSWIEEQQETRLAAWPELPETNGKVAIPVQPWPQRPGKRQVRVLVHYPGGKLGNVDARTGLMLSLHNWGGEDCVGTASPQALADRLNVVALCVNYLQSGQQDSIHGPEPYDFGYLQALDALRALWWMKAGLQSSKRPFNDGRIFATGGSGGGNVTLMANKLAPRTFACIIDLCGMKKLTADIAFNLPGGSDLNARWSRDPRSPNHLSADDQELRFVGHPSHLAIARQLHSTCRVVAVHGVEDTTCPFADAQEMVANMKAAGLSIEPHFLGKHDVDGKVFTSAGHALGDRTEIVFKVAGKHLAPDSAEALTRLGPSDFDRRDELVCYPTPGGQFVISYAAGFPVGRFEARPLPISADDHTELAHYVDDFGKPRPIRTEADWKVRRERVVQNLQRVMGNLPGLSQRVPLNVESGEEVREGEIVRRKIRFQSTDFDRVPAWLLLPDTVKGQKRPAILCLHQTAREGKNESVGLSGAANMHYGLELAKRGYIVIAPDYPSLGEHTYDFAEHPEFASGSLKAIWDNMRAIDVLETLPEVDRERIGVVGHSLGAHNALFTAVFEPRIKTVVSSCGFTSFAKDDVPSWNGPRYMPRIASEFNSDAKQLPFDFPEVIACLAPRPLFISAAQRDDDFDASGVADCVTAARHSYSLLGARSEALTAIYPDSIHDFPADVRSKAYEFLDQKLK